MSYTKTTWRNNQAPAINADNLNHMEQGIESAHNQIDVNTSNIGSLTTQVQNNATNIASEISARQSGDSSLQSQIDQLVAPTGEAPNPAEIENARIGDDGVTYDTLGNAIRTQFSDVKDDLNDVKNRFYDGTNLFNKNDTEVGLLRTTNGTIISSYTGYMTTNFMPVEYGDIIRFQFTLNANGKRYDLENTTALTFTNVCYYDENKQFISGSGSTVSTYLTISEATAKYIRISTNGYGDIHDLAIIKSNANGVILPYEDFGRVSLKDKNNTPYIVKGKSQYTLYQGAYSEEIKLSDVNTSAKGVLTSAKADISSFTNVELGLKSGNSVVVGVVVDATNVVVTDTRFGGNTVITHTFAHGLTITNEIGVQLFIDNTGIGFVAVSSNGVKYKSNNMNLIRANLGVPYFVASSTISNLNFSCALPMLNKDIWLFGDSYLQQTDSRWIYYMNQNEFDTYLTDAYSGENSADAFLSLKSSLELGKPKYIVWCLGMNDGADSNSQPNTTWKNYITAVQEICNSYDIELIMATIPTVPSINHEYKNSYIRNSGYKYIDFAKAVGAQSDGTWYTGMLSSDNVHPDVAGGIALYNQALTDFPQFAIK